ncbi:hypothetical protein CLU79DRAFT_380300 [Phycomyces nitens]|nr:hypothetical protein CLU79DRAFT_380300 [Phycomyces nitens]
MCTVLKGGISVRYSLIKSCFILNDESTPQEYTLWSAREIMSKELAGILDCRKR